MPAASRSRRRRGACQLPCSCRPRGAAAQEHVADCAEGIGQRCQCVGTIGGQLHCAFARLSSLLSARVVGPSAELPGMVVLVWGCRLQGVVVLVRGCVPG